MQSRYSQLAEEFGSTLNNNYQRTHSQMSLQHDYTIPIPVPSTSASHQPLTLTNSANNSSDTKRVGNIMYDTKQILGEADKTFVYKGTITETTLGIDFGRRQVAVKKICCGSEEDSQKNLKEVEVLLKCDEYKNIVKYFKVETDQDHNVFIAMELCLGTLQHWIENKIPEIKSRDINGLGILKQTTKGVEYLHGKPEAIIHRDLKPENILLRFVGKKVYIKITDFGISRELPKERTSLTARTTSGTKGWKSPEILNASSNASPHPRMSRATDIFSLGCVFYYVLSNGKHPFDKPSNPNPELRDSNIVRNKKYVDTRHFLPRIQGYVDLFEKMISHTQYERPTAAQIYQHSLFWGSQKQLNFLVLVSNVMHENRQSEAVQRCKYEIEEQHQHHIIQCDTDNRVLSPSEHEALDLDRMVNAGWLSQTCKDLKIYFIRESPRRYNGDLTRDLIRAIRNLSSHYESLPPSVKESLGPPPCSFMKYWNNKFPFLVLTVWNACAALLHEPGFDNIKIFYTDK